MQAGISKSSKKSYRYPLHKGWISHIEYLKVKEFPILRRGAIQGGLVANERISRVRPFGTLASRTIGDVFKESQLGKNGLELEYDSLLQGEYGLYIRRKKAGRNTDIIIKEPINGYDIVRVRCSRYGIVNWALSHDEVEIISPYDVVDEITERVCKLNEKYNNYNYMYSESLERLDKFIKEHKDIDDIDFDKWHEWSYIDPDGYSVRVRNKVACTADGLISIKRMYKKYKATSELVKEYKEYRKTPILHFPSEYNGINRTRARVFGDRPDHTLYDLKMYFEGSKDCRLGSAYKLPLTAKWLGSFKNFSDLTEWLGIKGIFTDENNEVFDLEYNDGTIIKGYAEKYDWKWSDAYYENLKKKIKEYEKMH